VSGIWARVWAWLETHLPDRCAIYDDDEDETKWFCWDCPDHEACATGWPCDNVRELGDRQAFQ
jgi:hypothetical protein